ncbi:MAG: hypothetical protein H6730_21615 [Deltaproteobacteria bacterium]|nr:hypothetical protein [Deltaproteobacteria bacterium]
MGKKDELPPALKSEPEEGYVGRGPETLATVFFFALFTVAIGAMLYLCGRTSRTSSSPGSSPPSPSRSSEDCKTNACAGSRPPWCA